MQSEFHQFGSVSVTFGWSQEEHQTCEMSCLINHQKVHFMGTRSILEST